jgi:acetyl esterase/lipase
MPSITVILCLAVAAVAIVVKVAPGEPEWKYDPAAPKSSTNEDSSSLTIRFLGGDGSTMLTGRLFRPPSDSTTTQPPPVIVLAHGLGLSQDATLDRYVEAFTASTANFAAFTFDYATFGASDGVPRHQVKPNRHVADIQAAIRMLKERQKELLIDADTMGLWGTSLGGGHALVVAAADDSLKVVVSQIPAILSGAESIVGTLL